MFAEKMFPCSSLPMEVIGEVHVPCQVRLFKSNHLLVFIKLHGACRVTKANATLVLEALNGCSKSRGLQFARRKNGPAIRGLVLNLQDAGRRQPRIFSGSLSKSRPAWPHLSSGILLSLAIICATENHCSPSNPVHDASSRSAHCSISQPTGCCERAVRIKLPQCERETCISGCVRSSGLPSGRWQEHLES